MASLPTGEQTFAGERGRKRLVSLDGVRGLAFLLVLLAHFSNHYGGPFKGVGKVGVWLFFVLSAFLLTSYFLHTPSKVLSNWEWKNYALRRFCRIVPMYLGAIWIYYLFQYVVTNDNLYSHLFFLDAKGHLWTILVEMKYYLILPIVVLALSKLMVFSALHLLSVFTIVLIVIRLIVPPENYPVSDTGAFTYLIIFVSGSLAAFIHVRQLGGSGPKADFAWDFAGVLALLLIVVTIPSIWSKLFYPIESTYFYRKYEIFSIIGAVLVLAASRDRSRIGRLLANRFLAYLGAISFSGYLIHPLILRQTSHMKESLGFAPAIVLTIVLVLLASSFLFFFIERRLMSVRLERPIQPFPVNSE